MPTTYVNQINGNPILAARADATRDGKAFSDIIPSGASSSDKLTTQSDVASMIANIGAYEVATLTTGTNPHPDVASPSHKIVYLTKESGSTEVDPYTEWIYTTSDTWEIIGETSIDLSGYKTVQSAKSDPSASGNSLTFIATITQNTNGEITATKKTVSTMGAASSSAAGTAGLVPAPGSGKQGSYLRGDGTWATPTDTKVKATAKTDNVNYKILATASASPTSGNATEAVYDTDITLNPSTNTIAANISGTAATASAAQSGSELETAINNKADATHTHTTSIATDSGTATVSLSANTTYKLTAGGTEVIFKTPADGNTDTKVKATAKTDNVNYKILATASASPTSGSATEAVYDTDISLNPSTNTITANISGNAGTATTASNYTAGGTIESALNGKADSGHTHTTSIAADSSSGTVTSLSANTQYKLTAGGTSVLFKTPASPTVNNAALKIQLNGGTATSKFTANASSDATLTFATGSSNGTIAVDGTNVAVKGLGSAAYTASTAYATSAQGTKADSAIQGVKCNTATLTPDSNKIVTIPAAGSSTYGVVTIGTVSI